MSYHPSKVNKSIGAEIPSGIVYFGHSPTGCVYEADTNFTIDGTYLNAAKIKLPANGTIGVPNKTNAITIGLNGDVSVLGNFTVNGTTTTVNSTTITIEDPIIILGSGTPTVDDNKDRGVSFNYFDGVAKTGFFGFDESTGRFTFIPDATITNEVVTGSSGIIVADLDGNANTASGLLNSRDFSVTGQIVASAVSFNGTNNVVLSANLNATAITAQSELLSVDSTGDYLLIYDADAASLKKINRNSFVSGLGGMDSFTVSDGITSESVNNGETITFADGTGAAFVVSTNGSVPTITVHSVDGEIVHNNLSGFDANEHINHTGVILTAGSGLSGGGDISASRTFAIDISEYNTTAVGSGDSFLMLDSDGLTEQRSTVDQLGTYMAGTNITNTNGVLSISDSAIDSVVFESANFVDGTTIDFTVTSGTSVTAEVKDNSITETKRVRTIETITTSKLLDKDVTLINATSSSVTGYLPENATAGRVMVVKRIDGNAESGPYDVVISSSGTDTIDGSNVFQLYYRYETLTFISNGSDWYII